MRIQILILGFKGKNQNWLSDNALFRDSKIEQLAVRTKLSHRIRRDFFLYFPPRDERSTFCHIFCSKVFVNENN